MEETTLPVETDIPRKLICQGAESRLYEALFENKVCIEKERVSKRYRVSELDQKLNKHRILSETRCMSKCEKAGIPVPKVHVVDTKKNRIIMEKIEGVTVKEYFLSLYLETEHRYPDECINIATKIGQIIGKLHDKAMVHGDLTTSNIIIRDGTDEVVLIDFGLGALQSVIEDRAVDLYVLERAMQSTHMDSEPLMEAILQAYRFACRQGTLVLLKLEQVTQLLVHGM